ncbi:MAG: UDP-N-acetylmuramoyl-L-alanyl-D-glutamate--2,6-diaminopimelate ligase [Gammaproteobacteria bacterium]|nr:UDP-N-acetylmuramoyl-L-alanyl-D-glutamate--2,6-diaminopimelate ligase [Gammaproteobacteria bacterium]
MEALLAPWGIPAPAKAAGGLAMDSREVVKGGIFLAVTGEQGHGLDYLDDAMAAGAELVVYEPSSQWNDAAVAARCAAAGIRSEKLPDLHLYVSEIAARYFGYPGKALRVIGVTGTDGKTSVVHYIAQLLSALGVQCGVLGTLGYGLPGQLKPTRHTTADPVSVQQQLQTLAQAGAKAVAMEVSSHALAQGRVTAVPFHTAVLTYLGRDHLDYHGSLEAYAAAKRKLFLWPGLACRVLNTDDTFGAGLAMLDDGVAVSRYGANKSNEWQVCGVQPVADGLSMQIAHAGKTHTLHVPLMGAFNAANVLAAVAAASWDQSAEEVLTATSAIRSVPGRMERFIGADGPLVIVDYAHTPGALESVLKALRQHTTGQLWCVFGCGGDRDKGKRTLMGEVASHLADRVVLTNDNPRGESPVAIIEDICARIPDRSGVSVELDRARAIADVISQADAKDVVLVAGKGHETVQWLGQQAVPFSDREQVEQQLLRRAG